MQLHVHPHLAGNEVEEDVATGAEALGQQALAHRQRQRAKLRACLRRRAGLGHKRAASREGDGRVGDVEV